MAQAARPLAVVTGASSGIDYELAHLCAKSGYDLVIAADRPEIHTAAEHFRSHGVHVQAVGADLATTEGVDKLCAATQGMPVDFLLANAGHGLGGGFLDQDFAAAKHVLDTNITGTIYLIHKIGRDMRLRGSGRILITGSIAGFMPGTYHAVYNGTKSFIDSFSFALRHELKGSGVSVTCLMPGVTETDFFDRAGMTDTRVGQGSKDDPAEVARAGFEAMMRGDGDVVSGWKNKMSTSFAAVTPAGMLAEQHRKMAEPLHSRHEGHDGNGHPGLWSVMLPAGLAVAAGVALMSTSRMKGSTGDHRRREGDQDFDRLPGYTPPSRSRDYPDGERMPRVRIAEDRHEPSLEVSSSAARMPYETARSGRDAVGASGAFRHASVDDPRGMGRVTK